MTRILTDNEAVSDAVTGTVTTVVTVTLTTVSLTSQPVSLTDTVSRSDCHPEYST